MPVEERRDALAGIGSRRSRWRGLAPAAIGACLGAATSLAVASATTWIDRADLLAFDAFSRLARQLAPGTDAPGGAGPRIVVVGIDQATLDELGVPMALVHQALGAALVRIATAKPRAIGLDIALPDRSFDDASGARDRALIAGLMAARRAAGLVIALDVDAGGRVRSPYLPFVAAAGGNVAFGLPFFPIDRDGAIRRFDPLAGAGNVPAFAARLAEVSGFPASLRQAGWIDFSRGAPFAYIPLGHLVPTGAAPQELDRQFAGAVVLVGSVLPFEDRLRVPVPLLAPDPQRPAVPGVVLNAQLLRNALGGGLLQRLPAPGIALAWILALLPALARPTRARAIATTLLFALTPVAGAAGMRAGWVIEPAAPLLAGMAAALARGVLEFAMARARHRRLALQLSGYLGPALSQSILTGADATGTRRHVAMLFADVCDFTRRAEHADPAHLQRALNLYFASVTPLLHAHGGTIDNFRGDGLMAVFGAPIALPHPCVSAFDAARQMLAAVARLNAGALTAEGLAPIEISIGLAFGEAVVGDVGGPDRKDFTAIGDAVNVAARLRDLAVQLDHPIVASDAFCRELGAGERLAALGVHALKGHSPVAVWGWRP